MPFIQITPVQDALVMKDAIAEVANLLPAVPQFGEVLLVPWGVRN